MKISRSINKLTTTQLEMAKVLGITQPRVNQLIQEGIVLKDDSGAVFIVESLKNYYKSKPPENGGNSEKDEADYWTEKALHERAKRKMAELLLMKKENSVYDAKHVELVMIEMLSNLRTQLLGLPNKLAPILENRNRNQIYEIMTRELEEKLSELSDYSPDLFTEEEIEDEITEQTD